MIEYEVELTLTEPMLGTVPKNRDVYSKFIEEKKQKRADKLAEGEPDETTTVPEVDESKGWTGFHTDDQGIFVYDYLVKGALKEAGNILKEDLKIKALKRKIDNYVFVFPRRVRITDAKGNPVTKPDSVFERPLRADTMQGPRVTLVKSDTVDAGRKLKFTIKVVDGGPIKSIDTVLERCMEYWELKGLGQFRNGSFGRCTKTMRLKKS